MTKNKLKNYTKNPKKLTNLVEEVVRAAKVWSM